MQPSDLDMPDLQEEFTLLSLTIQINQSHEFVDGARDPTDLHLVSFGAELDRTKFSTD